MTDAHPFQHESLTPQIFSLSRMTLNAYSLYRAVGGYGVKLGWITGQKELCYGAALGLEPKGDKIFCYGQYKVCACVILFLISIIIWPRTQKMSHR